jgi:DNA-binding transcriptional regulator YiaG
MMPIPRILTHIAQRLPGGLETLIVLAWLSGDESVRAIARRWMSLPGPIRRKVELEELCHETGVEAGRIGGKLATVAFELGINASPFIGSVQSFPAFLQTAFTTPGKEHMALKAMGLLPQLGTRLHRAHPAQRDESVSETDSAEPSEDHRRRGPSRRAARGQRVRSRDALHACEKMVLARKHWGLSQRQFANLFMTTVRTVRRWEKREFAPTPHQQWFLGVFANYVRERGLVQLREHFVFHQPD